MWFIILKSAGEACTYGMCKLPFEILAGRSGVSCLDMPGVQFKDRTKVINCVVKSTDLCTDSQADAYEYMS